MIWRKALNKARTVVSLALALVFSGCGANDEPPKIVMPDGSITVATNESDRELADLAAATLAEAIDVPLTRIKVESIRAVEWRDGSLGCPQPGQAYAQVITPGHRILLRVDTRVYAVHEANGRALVCQRKKATAEVTTGLEIAWGTKSIEARRDLAARLGVEEQHVVVSGATQTVWDDLSLGCPKPGMTYTPERVSGYIIRLRHGGREYTYHTDLEQLFPCPDFAER